MFGYKKSTNTSYKYEQTFEYYKICSCPSMYVRMHAKSLKSAGKLVCTYVYVFTHKTL